MPAYFSKIDLHSHSKASDGAFTPAMLVQRAIDRGLTHLALTDHDCIGGIEEAITAAYGKLQLIPGAELSATWNNTQIHIVGLFLDIKSKGLSEFLEKQSMLRVRRAEEIGHKLEKQGFANAYEECKKRATPGATITRGNYASYIVEMGRAQSTEDAFNCYLKKGKSCYVKTPWDGIDAAVNAIKAAGGAAVLAHPRRYTLTNTKLRALIEDFKSCGGDGLEVSSSQMKPDDRVYLASLCKNYDLKASLGSDFHNIGPFRELGFNLVLPDDVPKIWELEQAKAYDF